MVLIADAEGLGLEKEGLLLSDGKRGSVPAFQMQHCPHLDKWVLVLGWY